MNETTKKNLKRSLAGFLAVLMVAGLSYFAKDSALKADENAPETEVVREAADVPVEQVNEPEPEVVVQEIIVSASEPVVETPTPVEEPAPVEEPVPVAEPTPVEAPVSVEEPTLVEDPAPAEEKFDVEEAYEHYMSLTEDWQKEQYLNMLSAEDRAELKQYIADKEAEAAAAAAAQEAILAELAAQAEAETETEENAPAEEAPVMLTAAPETEEFPAEEIYEEMPVTEEEPEEEPVDLSFGSAHIAGEWTGRETSSARSLTINIYVDGNLIDTCATSANQSVANFVIYAGDNEITDVTTDYWAMSGSGAAWSVDMYGANDVTVNVNMKSLLPAEEEAPAEEAEGTEEAAEETELTEEPEEAGEAEPSYGVTEEWAGRATSTDRTVHLIFKTENEEIETRDIVGRNTEVTFSVAAEGYTVLSVESDAELSNDGDLYTVDMNAIYEATVTVTLEAPEVEEEAEEELPAEEAETEAEAETEPTEEVTVTEENASIEAEVTVTEEEKTAEAEETVTVVDDNKTVEIAVTGDEKTIEAEPAEEEIRFTFVRDEDGNLVLDENGDPVIEVEGGKKITIEYERDEEGELVLDENGDPIVIKVEEIPEKTEEYNGRVEIRLELVSGDSIAIGSTVKWVSEILDDAEGLELTYQWLETEDGENWYPIEGANEPEYELVITEENFSHLWKVRVL